MTHEERVNGIKELFEFGYPIPLAIEAIKDAFRNEQKEDLRDTLAVLIQTAINQGIKQGKHSLMRSSIDAIKQLSEQ